MNVSHRALVQSLGNTYTDIFNHTVSLTASEQEYFRTTVTAVLAATGMTIPVYTCDHEKLPSNCCDALGIHWRREDGGDEFITVDNYYIHEAYAVAYRGAFDLTGETLVSVLCHELAHIRYQRHTKYHAALTAQLMNMVSMEAMA